MATSGSRPPLYVSPKRSDRDIENQATVRAGRGVVVMDAPAPARPMVSSGMMKAQSVKKVVAKKAVQEREDFHILLFASFCLCFNAGMVNVITLSSYFALASAHVTGLVAKTSILLADAQWDMFYLPATAWLCFLIGATYAGYTITYETFYLGRSYGRHLLLIAGVQAVALAIDRADFSKSATRHDYIYGCAVACGLQNGLTSKYSGNTIRTTHLTGATTDLGIALGHVLKGRYEDIWKLKLHSTSIVGFLLGGICGRLGYHAFKETTLVINVLILTLLGFAHMGYLAHMEQLPLMDVARARVDIKVHHHHLQSLTAGLDEDEARIHRQKFKKWASQQNLERIRTNRFNGSGSLKSFRERLGSNIADPSAPGVRRNHSNPGLAAMASAGGAGRGQNNYELVRYPQRHPDHHHAYDSSSRASSPQRSLPYSEDGYSLPTGGDADNIASEYLSSSEEDYDEAEHSGDVDEFDLVDIAAQDSTVADLPQPNGGDRDLPTLTEARTSLERQGSA